MLCRARKDVRDGFDKEMAAARLRRQLEEEWQWAKVAFESGWKSIERETPQCVTFQDVPWPPDESDMLASLAAIELPNVEPLVKGAVGHAETLKMEYIAFRRAFKAASLRWHPDKFAHRFQGVLDVKHREKILSRAQLIAQQVNMEWEVFQQSRNMPPQM
ncbi:hypothetical protein BSKO_09973 [Bryopsis sp. KO-2023]|nr:hypothetical protein BSKO_09973 [Bryopsis sp. KO-2023]